MQQTYATIIVGENAPVFRCMKRPFVQPVFSTVREQSYFKRLRGFTGKPGSFGIVERIDLPFSSSFVILVMDPEFLCVGCESHRG